MEKRAPKILIFTVSAWNSKVGANTWGSLLSQYDSKNLANVCIRNEIPDSKVCTRYFSISESKIIKSIFNRKIKTGQEIKAQENAEWIESDLQEHNARYQKMTRKRSYFKLLCRELVWKLGKWKTQEFKDFLDDFKPDIILHSFEGYIHLNRMISYAIKRTGAKAIGYVWDDNFTYKQSKKIGHKIYRYFQRKSVKKLRKQTEEFFAITEKAKREADKFFGVDCHVLSKPLNAAPLLETTGSPVFPLKMLYTGNLLIGRDKTLQKIVDAVQELNDEERKFEIDVYTQTQLSEEKKAALQTPFCRLHEPIAQAEVLEKQKQADVLLFLEDLGKENLAARLSFSTKITDYLSAGKCIFAAGNMDLAPIEYFQENAAAIVACEENEIKNNLLIMINEPNILQEFAQNAAKCGLEKHDREMILNRCDQVIQKVYRGEK